MTEEQQKLFDELDIKRKTIEMKANTLVDDATKLETTVMQKELDGIYNEVEDAFNNWAYGEGQYTQDEENPYEHIITKLLDIQTTIDDHRRYLLREVK
jgi:hypothetical protein